jgi:4-hydroxy-tetrahydrodipicolinate synthase
MFHGSLVALVTPMKMDGSVDLESLEKLLEWHIHNDTDGIVILGSTGEAATLNDRERTLIIRHTLAKVANRVPVIVGTGTNSTITSVQRTQQAMDLGVDACLLVTPYYNKPTQEGLYLHYKTIAEAVAIPQIMYNVPSRTGCDLQPETAARLAKFSNIIGFKEATGDVSRVAKILELSHKELDLYSGDDESSLDFMLEGGKGVITVVGNVAPKLMHDMCTAALSGNKTLAQTLNQKLIPLHAKLFVESNPIPVKWALYSMGLIDGGIRLPLTPLSHEYHVIVADALSHADITLGESISETP